MSMDLRGWVGFVIFLTYFYLIFLTRKLIVHSRSVSGFCNNATEYGLKQQMCTQYCLLQKNCKEISKFSQWTVATLAPPLFFQLLQTLMICKVHILLVYHFM